MQDVRFVAALAVTSLSTYFNRDDEVEPYLDRFNDDFPLGADLERELDATLETIDTWQLPDKSRAWKRADLFSLIVEVHRALFKANLALDPRRAADCLLRFYAQVDDPDQRAQRESDAARYYKAALQATNDKASRVTRGDILRALLEEAAGH